VALRSTKYCTTYKEIHCHILGMLRVEMTLAAGRWFSTGPPVSSTNKTDRHDITEILLKVALSIIALTINLMWLTLAFIEMRVPCQESAG
jgi:hypothetical protein